MKGLKMIKKRLLIEITYTAVQKSNNRQGQFLALFNHKIISVVKKIKNDYFMVQEVKIKKGGD